MANLPGPQEYVKFCPACKEALKNVPRQEMKSRGYVRSDGNPSPDTHTYKCTECGKSFEINQDR